mmetsp:Transcript_6734/g.11868  ORF Transcript_6734/g.11868 Transcript_6734/m.11868 type:complete len:1134 (+) Transcript_6734:262-3663(+)
MAEDAKALEGDAYAMDRYSRQIGAYGVEAMAKLVKMRVLIVGVRGVGIEVAKNLVLAGPGAVTLADETPVAIQDLGTNFFLREDDVGNTTRAEASVSQLRELNRLVDVKAHKGELTEDLVKSHTAMVMCGVSRTEAIKWNKFCRDHNVGFFLTGIHGLFGYVFVDLGKEFTIRDKNGEQVVTRIIDGIDTSVGEPNECVVHLLPPPDGKRHGLEDDPHEGWITLDEIDGELGQILNQKGPFRAKHVYFDRIDKKTGKTIKAFDAYALKIKVEGVSALPAYVSGGTMTQQKVPVKISHRSFETACTQPVTPGEYGLLFTDGTKFGRAEQLHVALQGLWDFEEQNGKLPEPNNEDEIEEVINCTIARNKRMKDVASSSMEDDSGPASLALEEIEEDVVKWAAQHAGCEFQPLSTFFGGVVAQEVVKMTGKFTPLNQWLHIDTFEVLPELFVDKSIGVKVSKDDRKPIGSRYDDLIMILGRPLQEELTRKSTFMVGCGALGCELMKNFALLGIACAKDGSGVLTVTDNDTIEVSNLSRQFLFREHNVGQPKSAAASEAAVEMNPDFHVVAKQNFVGPNTETIFDGKFWDSLDFVTNALDNVKARLYVDSRCVFFEKPLFESGTLGTKCNVQVVLPHLTANYGSGPSDGDDGDAIPMCTLRNFPSQIEHCIEWARARFNDYFTTVATTAGQFCETPDAWLSEMRKKTIEETNQGKLESAVATELGPLREMVELLNRAKSPNNCFAECVKDAYALFHTQFRDNIVSLISTYPEDATDRQGNPFWSGTKRFPQAARFDVKNLAHMNFIIAAANILAVNLGLQPSDQPLPETHPWRSPSHVAKIVSKLAVPELKKEKVDMSGGGEEDSQNDNDMDMDQDAAVEEFKDLLAQLEEMKSECKDLLIEPADFEKDADWNFHIDFITAASNLRAWNYRLKPATRHKSKMIAGKIIPALATTTAAVTGLVMVEIIKSIQPGKKLEAFKDSSNSLAINGYFFSEPSQPERAKDEYDPVMLETVKCRPEGFTIWDKTKIKEGSLTLQEFLNAFKAETGLNCSTLNHESANREGSNGHGKFIYEENAWKKELKELYNERLNVKLEDIIDELYGDEALPDGTSFVPLEIDCNDDNDETYKVPEVVYFFK